MDQAEYYDKIGMTGESDPLEDDICPECDRPWEFCECDDEQSED